MWQKKIIEEGELRMRTKIIEKVEQRQLKTKIPEFRVGDTIRLHTRIIEGDKERTQMFQGTVIARKGSGLSETISLHRIAYGEGMERVFLLNSPRISKIDIVKHGKVRRSKLYYLRGTTGKKAKVQSRLLVKGSKKPSMGNEAQANLPVETIAAPETEVATES